MADKRIVAATRALVFLAASLAAAGAQAIDIKPLLKVGYDVGGDTIIEIPFTSGEREKVRANEGFHLGGGAAIIDADRNMEYHLSLAYKAQFINAENGDVDWSRIPLEALAFYRFQHVRVGGGLTYHMSPKVDGSGAASFVDIEFKNALGLILQADWRFGEKIGLGARYTMIEYDGKRNFSGTAKANGVGITFSVSF